MPGKPVSTPRAWKCLLLVSALALGWACDDGPAAPEPPTDAVVTVTGTVRIATNGRPIAGAVVTAGSATATTGSDGGYALTGLRAGSLTIRASAAGFEDGELRTTIPGYDVARELALTRRESFAFGEYALFAPGGPDRIRAVLVALGGPDTRGFAAGSPFGAPMPELEAALQDLGGRFRGLAVERDIAVLGTSLAAMPNAGTSDEALRDALREAASVSARPELADAPLMLYGISGGAPEASGFAARNPERVAALFLKVPAAIEPVAGAALEVPVFVVLAELDAFVDNAALTASFAAARAAGAPWARVVERDVVHHSLSAAQRTVTLDWMRAILGLRLGGSPTSALRSLEPTSGWLGDTESGDILPWPEFPGDAAAASWLPTEATAEKWQWLGAVRGPSGLTLVLDRSATTISVERLGHVTARVFDADGRRIPRPDVRFSSSAEQFARLLNDTDYCESSCLDAAVILGVAPGAVRLAAEFEGARDEADVTVVPAVGTLVVEPTTATIAVGETIVLTAKLVDGTGAEIPYPPVSFSWWSTDWGWDPGAVTIADVEFVPGTDRRQLRLTGKAPGTATYSVYVDGPIGPDPAISEVTSLVTVE